MHIRQIDRLDFDEINDWWNHKVGHYPCLDLYPELTTWVVEDYKDIIACVSLITTNCSVYCLIDNLSVNPWVPKEQSRQAIHMLTAYTDAFAKKLGYSKIVGMTLHDVLAERYINYGYDISKRDVIIVEKEL